MNDEVLRQHAVALMTLYGISAHQLARNEALEVAEQVADDPAAADLLTTRQVFDYYDRVLNLRRTGPVQQ